MATAALALELALVVAAPVLERLSDAIAAPLAAAGVRMPTATRQRVSASAKASKRALLGALRELRVLAPGAPSQLEAIVMHLK